MAQNSSIEWTDATWNPVRGCTKISPGCKHCYAETFAERFRGVKGHPYEQGFDLRLVPEKLCDQRLRKLLATKLSFAATHPHIWWGVSAEDKKYGLPRIEDLGSTKAAIRFLSVEPLLEDLGQLDLNGIDWMIVGGESGAGARPMKKEWVLSLRDQCKRSRVAFFFKQWGGVRKALTGRRLDGKTYDEFPARVQHPVMSAAECASASHELGAFVASRDLFPLSSLQHQKRPQLCCQPSYPVRASVSTPASRPENILDFSQRITRRS